MFRLCQKQAHPAKVIVKAAAEGKVNIEQNHEKDDGSQQRKQVNLLHKICFRESFVRT